MGYPALKLHDQPSVSFPAWLETSDDYASLSPHLRRTLHAISDLCTKCEPDGSLTGAFGGRQLYEQAGCSRRTLFRHITTLEAMGLIVTLARGGVIGTMNYGNIYGIPGKPGALDIRRCDRRMIRMVKGNDGKHRPQVVKSGDQMAIWPTSDRDSNTPPPPDRPQAVHPVHNPVDNLSTTTPSRAVRVVPNGTGVVPNGTPSGSGVLQTFNYQSEGVSPCKPTVRRSRVVPGVKGLPGVRGEPTMANVVVDDLRDTDRLLGLFADAVSRGMVSQSDQDRIRFVAAAVHSLRIGDKPAALFASTVRNGRWLFISQDDESNAQRMLATHARRISGSAHIHTDKPPRPKPTLSPDAKLVTAAMLAVARHGKGDALAVVRSQHAGWTRDRWDKAVAQVKQHRNKGYRHE